MEGTSEVADLALDNPRGTPQPSLARGWVSQAAQVVEQRTENQVPGRAASVLLALTHCWLVVKRDKPSRVVAVIPSCSDCESHCLSHCLHARTVSLVTAITLLVE